MLKYQHSGKRGQHAVILFFVILTLTGLLTCAQYGRPIDEGDEQIILQQNMHEYACRLLGENSSAAQFYRARGILRISDSIEKDHGECAYYAFTPFLHSFAQDGKALNTAWQCWTWMLFMLGVISLYGFLRECGTSRFSGCIGSLLIYLSPRFFAEGHYNNKDIVLLALVLCTLYTGIRFLKKPCLLRGFLMSLAGAAAANTKIIGVLPWTLIGVGAVILLTAQKKWKPDTILLAASTILSFLVFYILLTPAAWIGTSEYIQYLVSNAASFSRWTGTVIFEGNRIDTTCQALPRSYLPKMILYTLPLYTLPLTAIGEIRGLPYIRKKHPLADPVTIAGITATLMWIIPLAAFMIIRPLIYNGWRHFYFLFSGIAIMAGLGADALLRFAKAGKPLRSIPAALLCLCLLSSALGIAINHPHQYAYYNILCRSRAQSEMEVDYWTLSTRDACTKLLLKEGDGSLEIGALDPLDLISLYRTIPVLNEDEQKRINFAEDIGEAPYLLSNTTYQNLYKTGIPESYSEVIRIESYGLHISSIYKAN